MVLDEPFFKFAYSVLGQKHEGRHAPGLTLSSVGVKTVGIAAGAQAATADPLDTKTMQAQCGQGIKVAPVFPRHTRGPEGSSHSRIGCRAKSLTHLSTHLKAAGANPRPQPGLPPLPVAGKGRNGFFQDSRGKTTPPCVGHCDPLGTGEDHGKAIGSEDGADRSRPIGPGRVSNWRGRASSGSTGVNSAAVHLLQPVNLGIFRQQATQRPTMGSDKVRMIPHMSAQIKAPVPTVAVTTASQRRKGRHAVQLKSRIEHCWPVQKPRTHGLSQVASTAISAVRSSGN